MYIYREILKEQSTFKNQFHFLLTFSRGKLNWKRNSRSIFKLNLTEKNQKHIPRKVHAVSRCETHLGSCLITCLFLVSFIFTLHWAEGTLRGNTRIPFNLDQAQIVSKHTRGRQTNTAFLEFNVLTKLIIAPVTQVSKQKITKKNKTSLTLSLNFSSLSFLSLFSLSLRGFSLRLSISGMRSGGCDMVCRLLALSAAACLRVVTAGITVNVISVQAISSKSTPWHLVHSGENKCAIGYRVRWGCKIIYDEQKEIQKKKLTIHTAGSESAATQGTLKVWCRSINQHLLSFIVSPPRIAELGSKTREETRLGYWFRSHQPVTNIDVPVKICFLESIKNCVKPWSAPWWTLLLPCFEIIVINISRIKKRKDH